MSNLDTNIDFLMAPGIIAALTENESRELVHGGGDAPPDRRSWLPLMERTRELLKLTKEKYVRVVFGPFTIMARESHGEIAVLTVRTGDPISKSVHRMVIRSARKVRKPTSRSNTQLTHREPSRTLSG